MAKCKDVLSLISLWPFQVTNHDSSFSSANLNVDGLKLGDSGNTLVYLFLQGQKPDKTPPHPRALNFVCFVVINPPVLSANRVDLGLFCFINFPFLLPPPPEFQIIWFVISTLTQISSPKFPSVYSPPPRFMQPSGVSVGSPVNDDSPTTKAYVDGNDADLRVGGADKDEGGV